ncbi:MAG TPA: hypothetical protein VLH39_00360 [Magnetospirillaceae bacterium]|nr:hypothetical protein [Magnetospirillaceae bacterium]
MWVSIEGPDSAGEASAELEHILGVTVFLALKRAGWTAVLDTSGVPPDDASEFRLSVRYSLNGGRVVLSFQMEDTRKRVSSETRDLERDLDPQFDAAVGRTVTDLARSMHEALAALPVPEAPAVPPPELPAPEIAEEVVPVEPVVALEPELPSRGPSGLRLGGGALVPVGEAAEYFRAALRFEAAWLLPTARKARWVLAASFAGFPLDGAGAIEAAAEFFHVGIGAEYPLIRKKSFGLDLRILAGPVLSYSRGEESSPVLKLLPFVQAGMAAGYRPSPRWELGLSAAFLVLLDNGETLLPLRPVLGLTPALTVTRELK